MKAENAELKDAVKFLMNENQQIKNRLASMDLIQGKLASFPDVPKEHWANTAVETLHGNGYIQGYPDGEFKGEQRMTRYEYAEMLYNALSRGAKVNTKHVAEYAPELKKVHQARVQAASAPNPQSKAVKVVANNFDEAMQRAGQKYNENH